MIKKSILISIKSIFSRKIMDGTKNVELRRKIGKEFKKDARVYIYSTTPEKSIIGYAEIESISKFSLTNIDEKHINDAAISKSDFIDYFSGLEYGYAIQLKNVVQLNNKISLKILKENNIYPPQSFSYILDETINNIMNEIA